MAWDEHIATGIVYWGHIGVMEKKMETIGILGFI